MNNGVVHVGAHQGEEISGYVAESRWPIICFEPQTLPRIGNGHAIFVNTALADFDGSLTLRIPRLLVGEGQDTQMASALPLIHAQAIKMGWADTSCDEIEVRASRFDTWARQTGLFWRDCSLLVIDAHGMELAVLRGFGNLLGSFEELVIECSAVPCWEGGASTDEVERYVHSHGFTRVSPIVPCGDVKFKRKTG